MRPLKFRAFISADISPNDRLAGLLEELRRSSPQLKVVKPSILHVTLKFLGDTEEAMVEEITEIMKRSAQDIGTFSLKLRGMGAFPSLSNMRVVWVGIEDGKELAVLAERLDGSLEQLGVRRDKRAFRPHLTVARAKGTMGGGAVQDIVAANTATDYGEYTIDRVTLKKSVLTPQGPIYSDVRSVQLG